MIGGGRLAAGRRLGHYEIVGPIGAGGMGEVYRAHDSRLHRDVALGWSLCFQRRYDEALAQLRKTVEIDPHFARVYWDLGITYEQKAMYDEPIAAFQNGLELSGDKSVWLGGCIDIAATMPEANVRPPARYTAGANPN